MGAFVDLTNQVINGILFVRRVENDKHNKSRWEVECHCGAEFVVVGSKVKSGHTQSCGCSIRKHGESGTSLHRVWKDMKKRCYNPNVQHYNHYGGRGIKVCEEWKSDFMSFKTWCIENGYREGLSIDRINNDEGYSPENCRWTNRVVQGRNRRVSQSSVSGVSGVIRNPYEKWEVSIVDDAGKKVYLGSLSDLREAVDVRRQAECEYWGYTKITEEQTNEILEREAILKNERTESKQ